MKQFIQDLKASMPYKVVAVCGLLMCLAILFGLFANASGWEGTKLNAVVLFFVSAGVGTSALLYEKQQEKFAIANQFEGQTIHIYRIMIEYGDEGMSKEVNVMVCPKDFDPNIVTEREIYYYFTTVGEMNYLMRTEALLDTGTEMFKMMFTYPIPETYAYHVGDATWDRTLKLPEGEFDAPDYDNAVHEREDELRENGII